MDSASAPTSARNCSQPARVSFTRTSPGRPGPAPGRRAARRPPRDRRCSPRSQLLDPLDDQGEHGEDRGGDGEESEIWHERDTPEVVRNERRTGRRTYGTEGGGTRQKAEVDMRTYRRTDVRTSRGRKG